MKTAVEWLEQAIALYVERCSLQKEFEQAKEIEKEQLCYFYIKGAEAELNNPYITNIEFYNNTFKDE